MAAPLAIVVVNFASTGLLRQHLVKTATDVRPDHVVVVDNWSSRAELDHVGQLARRQGWDLVAAESNLGFGGGVNLGVQRALQLGAEDILLLNPDASISAESVRILQERASTERDAVFSPLVLDSDGKVWFDGADVYLSDGVTRSVRKRFERPGEVRWEWLSGACLLVTDAAWRMSGGFDEDYFLYWEDVDFSRRIVGAGGSLYVVPEATAIHDEGGTQRVGAPQRAKSEGYYYYNIRNRLLFAAKHLDTDDARRWRRGAWASAREVLLRGGRRQFLRPWKPLRAAFRGVRDGRGYSVPEAVRRRQGAMDD
ncbi:glycosyltransferase family 2 protein [Microbacterium sp. CIAB417]|uniref:glycosyltransferase family 2 protein n=1 Tax=Microbacterium sp. CIAB417 TaxID=2860287 RepID=UPI001FAB3EA0|nr:glycosyltransferase family 2 protein [Microbacterium sp. CIAB417]